MTTKTTKTKWQYLEQRPDSWRKQLYLVGRKLRAHNVWSDMMVNQWSLEETAYNWDLPIEAVREAIEYCQTHLSLLEQEAESERLYLEEQGVSIEPKTVG